MIPIYAKSVDKRGFVAGFAYNPVTQESVQRDSSVDLINPTEGAQPFRKARRTVWVPVALVALEGGGLAISALGDLHPLVPDEEFARLRETEIPEDVLEEGRELRDRLRELERRLASATAKEAV